MPTPAPSPLLPFSRPACGARFPSSTRNPQPATRNYPFAPTLSRSKGPPLSRSKGFTLTEILVVIGIIIVLISILLPVISKVRYAAYNADTQNEISQISNACTSYYSTFHAYPGPFSNDELSGTNPYSANAYGPPSLTQIYFNGAAEALSADTAPNVNGSLWSVTGAENLVLGLMGGLRWYASNPTQVAFAPSEVGLGPLSINPNTPTRYPSFMSTGSNYLMWCQGNANSTPQNPQIVHTTGAYQSAVAGTFTGTPFADPASTFAFDCPIPVFVDRFPSPGPLPILYLRARTGAPGVIWDNNNIQYIPGTTQLAYYQYDLRDILPYTSSHIGQPSNGGHNLQQIGPFPPNGAAVVKSNANAPYPAQIQTATGAYFMNSSIPATTVDGGVESDYTGRPRAVDQFILISAGQDGMYGTADDITSFGSVSQ